MSWRGTVVLLVLIVAAGAYLWFEGTPPDAGRPASPLGAQPAREAAEPIQHVLLFDPTTVVAVYLEHEGKVRHAERDRSEWQGLENPAAIDDFLHNLATVGVLTEISADDQSDLKEYGLRPPRSIVQLHIRGAATPVVLQIGDRNPATTGVYVRVGESARVILAGALVTWEFDKVFKTLADAPAGNQ